MNLRLASYLVSLTVVGLLAADPGQAQRRRRPAPTAAPAAAPAPQPGDAGTGARTEPDASPMRAAVAAFRGPGAAAVRRSIRSGSAGVVSVVSQREVDGAVRRLRTNPASEAGAADLARTLSVTFVVTGEVRGRGRAATTTIEVRNALGAVVATRELRPAAGRRGRTELEEAAAAAVREAVAAEERRVAQAAEAAAAAEPDARAQLEGASGDAGSDDERPSQEGAEDEAGDGAGRTARPLLRLMAGAVIRNRVAEVELMSGDLARYDSGFFPELGLFVEARPLARSSGPLRGLLLSADFSLAVGLSSTDATGGAMGSIDTSAMRLHAGLGYLGDLGSLELGGGVGFGLDSFSLGMNDIMPSASYASLRPHLMARLALAGDGLLTAHLDAGLLIALSVGDIGTTFGASGSAFGFDVGGGILGALPMGLTYGLRVGFQRYGLGFEGVPAQANRQASGGSDAAFVSTVTVGYQIR